MMYLLRRPLMSGFLLLVWLTLTGFSLGWLILGLFIVGIAMFASEPLELLTPRVRSWPALLRLFGVVFADIVRSNIAVVRLILSGPREAQRRAGFLEMTLSLKSPNSVALLALIVTATPGTAWLDYEPSTGRLLIHILDLADPEDWRQLIHGRYEVLLNEAFE